MLDSFKLFLFQPNLIARCNFFVFCFYEHRTRVYCIVIFFFNSNWFRLVLIINVCLLYWTNLIRYFVGLSRNICDFLRDFRSCSCPFQPVFFLVFFLNFYVIPVNRHSFNIFTRVPRSRERETERDQWRVGIVIVQSQ